MFKKIINVCLKQRVWFKVLAKTFVYKVLHSSLVELLASWTKVELQACNSQLQKLNSSIIALNALWGELLGTELIKVVLGFIGFIETILLHFFANKISLVLFRLSLNLSM